MLVRTSELTGPALDWAVAKCEGADEETLDPITFKYTAHASGGWCFSTDWSQGGPIIEREQISIWTVGVVITDWRAEHPSAGTAYGPTPLIAAMRCYVASKLGDEVDIPEELKWES